MCILSLFLSRPRISVERDSFKIQEERREEGMGVIWKAGMMKSGGHWRTHVSRR